MSITSATDRLASTRRAPSRPMVGALLLVVGLIAVVVAIAVSGTASTDGRLSAGPPRIDAPALTGLIGAPDLSVPGGTFRDPSSHALLAVGTSAVPQRASGHGPQ